MIILGVDFGRARTGLSICDKGEMLAVPLCVVTEGSRAKLIEKIAELASVNKVEQIVVGLPRNMDGSEGASAINAKEFGSLLSEETGINVDFIDERGTTITAHNYLNDVNVRGKKRKNTVDAVAATLILQNYLDKRKNVK